METIFFPDDTLPGFDYLDRLSEVSENSIEKAIEDWQIKYNGDYMETILTPEVE